LSEGSPDRAALSRQQFEKRLSTSIIEYRRRKSTSEDILSTRSSGGRCIIKGMKKEEIRRRLTDIVSSFINYMEIVLPDDVERKLAEMEKCETAPLQRALYKAMRKNQERASALSRPSCQDTGVIQFWIRCGSSFPGLSVLEDALREAVRKSTLTLPLRPNTVETFDEYNTGNNIASGAPTLWWDIIPDRSDCIIYAYAAGGGCSLPGKAKVLMPGEGYEGIVDFVIDQTAEYGPNACPPLFVGVGVGNSSETAALNAKKALMRGVGSHSGNEKVAGMERLFEDALNSLHIGPQGLGGERSVMGVNIVAGARHPATLGVAVAYGCWSFRRGSITITENLSVESDTHPGFIYEGDGDGRA